MSSKRLLNAKHKALYPLIGKHSKLLPLKYKLLLYNSPKTNMVLRDSTMGSSEISNINKMQVFQSISLRSTFLRYK